jgi:Putative MetA-pathway of phenol degradation
VTCLQAHTRGRRARRSLFAAALPFVSILWACDAAAATEVAVTDSETRQSLEDAWWTGPILAASAASAPRGHFQVEPYFYDSTLVGHFDQDGRHRSVPRTHSARYSTFILYGLSDRVSVGVVPIVGFNRASNGSRSKLGLGDLSLQAQYRITDFQQGRPIPTTSILLAATIPTGRYERLDSRLDDGLGSGAYTATASVYSQYFFWLPTGRLLRTRLDLSFSISAHVNLHDVSVYGTPQGFRGYAAPGDTFAAYVSGEYSVTRNWVLAFEVGYQHGNNTRVIGRNLMAPGRAAEVIECNTNSGSSRSTVIAPELEYSWNSRVGLLAGVIFTVSGRNVGETITPTLAINYNL